MKVLVATRQTQGRRPTDVAECIPGELVLMLEPCDTSQRSPYGPCDCGRTFRGLFTDAVTTTAAVREIAGFTRDDFIVALTAHHEQTVGCACQFPVADEMANELLALADGLPENCVLERRLDWLKIRKPVIQR